MSRRPSEKLRTEDDGRRSMVIGHLIDSGDLKSCPSYLDLAIIYTFMLHSIVERYDPSFEDNLIGPNFLESIFF